MLPKRLAIAGIDPRYVVVRELAGTRCLPSEQQESPTNRRMLFSPFHPMGDIGSAISLQAIWSVLVGQLSTTTLVHVLTDNIFGRKSGADVCRSRWYNRKSRDIKLLDED